MADQKSYDLYVDDSGNRNPDKRDPVLREDGVDAFALGGFLIDSDDIGLVISGVKELSAKFSLTSPLHSHEIRCRKNGYTWLGEDETKANEFYNDLSMLLISLPIYVTGCIIDRPGYNRRYGPMYGEEKWMLCRSAYSILIERAAKFSLAKQRRLKVYVEASGRREENAIREYHRALLVRGAGFNEERSAKYNPLGSVNFSSVLMKNPNFVSKNNPMMQIADLVLWPIIKGRYNPAYKPFRLLQENGKLIDSSLEDVSDGCGIKYYCFEQVGVKKQGAEKAKGSETRAPAPPSTTTPGRD